MGRRVNGVRAKGSKLGVLFQKACQKLSGQQTRREPGEEVGERKWDPYVLFALRTLVRKQFFNSFKIAPLHFRNGAGKEWARDHRK